MTHSGDKNNSQTGYYTLMLLGRKARSPLRIQLSKRLLWCLGLIALILVAGILFLLFGYVKGRFDLYALRVERQGLLAQNARLVERGNEKDQQLVFLSDKMRAVEMTLERIEEMEGRVRVLSQGEGLGGPLIVDDAKRTPLIKTGANQAEIAQFYASAQNIMERIQINRVNLSRVVRFFTARRSEILQIPSRWPLRGWVTSLFGARTSPFTGEPDMHDGIDIAAPEGAVIRAPAAGQVIFSGQKGGYGNVLMLRHGRGITTLYAHLTRALVEEGIQVPSGAPIALVGNTGRSTGPHVHYEVRMNNIPVNPMRFLPVEKEPETPEPTVSAPLPAPASPSAWPSQPVPAQPADQDVSVPTESVVEKPAPQSD